MDEPKPVRPWDLFLQKERAENSVVKSRLDICAVCPEYIKLTKQCMKCGCIMPFKTKLPEATCPLGKWREVEPAELGIEE